MLGIKFLIENYFLQRKKNFHFWNFHQFSEWNDKRIRYWLFSLDYWIRKRSNACRLIRKCTSSRCMRNTKTHIYVWTVKSHDELIHCTHSYRCQLHISMKLLCHIVYAHSMHWPILSSWYDVIFHANILSYCNLFRFIPLTFRTRIFMTMECSYQLSNSIK